MGFLRQLPLSASFVGVRGNAGVVPRFERGTRSGPGVCARARLRFSATHACVRAPRSQRVYVAVPRSERGTQTLSPSLKHTHTHTCLIAAVGALLQEAGRDGFPPAAQPPLQQVSPHVGLAQPLRAASESRPGHIRDISESRPGHIRAMPGSCPGHSVGASDSSRYTGAGCSGAPTRRVRRCRVSGRLGA